MSEPIKLPRSIDDPPEILLWSADEFIPMLVCVGIGILLDHFFIMLLIGIILWRALRKYKSTRPDGHMLHALYWIGLPLGKAKMLTNAYRRHWHG